MHRLPDGTRAGSLKPMIRSFGGKRPQVHPTAFVSEAAYVIGDVAIGAHSSVWPGAVIRGDHGHIAIGEHTNVQDNSVVHSDADARVGSHVTIGHRVVCHATEVHDYVLLGNGAVLNDGVVVEHHAIVAAGAVVLEGRRVGSGTVWAGAPAELRGRLLKRHRELLEHAAASYTALAERYKEEGLE